MSKATDTRWLVETSTQYRAEYGHFLDVGAPSVTVTDGALLFRDASGEVDHILAAGTWLSVTREDQS